MEIEFKILGSPLVSSEGQEITIPPQLQCVLVSLLMAPGMPVSLDILIDRLWGDVPPRKARTTIRSYIWRLERALSQAANDGVRVLHQGYGYKLDIEPDAVDLHRFKSLCDQSEILVGIGDTRRATMLLREAAGIWRGTALPGLSGPWIEGRRQALNEDLRNTIVRRIDLELSLGRHAQLLAELSELSDRYSDDEKIIYYRMLALFRAGRQSDALRVYRETQAKLAADGMDPAPELAELHQRILRHDPELAFTQADQRPSATDSQPNNLPAGLDDLIGRTGEIRELTREPAMPGQPAVRIVEGMPGIGKTSLAVYIGHTLTGRYPDAQLYLRFRAHDQVHEPLEPADALRELLIMLGVRPERIPGTSRERGELWRAGLASRRSVIIFDDVTGPDQIRSLLPDRGDCLIVVTTRRRHPGWNSCGSDVMRLKLPVLSEDDALTLFTRTAGRGSEHAAGEHAAGEHAAGEHAAGLARLCGGLPQAILTTAGHLRSGEVTTAAHLTELLDEHTQGSGRTGDLIRRIRAIFELSYRQLADDEQRFFRYLGISPLGSVTALSGAVICGCTEAEAQAALVTLSCHHLLDEVAPGRYTLHDLIRDFAAARFASENPGQEARSVGSRLADYYMISVRHALDDNTSEWLQAERRNALRVAQYCAQHELKRQCADLVHVLSEFLEADGHWEEALTAQAMALQACRELDDLPRIARAAFKLSLTSLRIGRSEQALRQAAEAATLFGTLGDKRGQAAALDRLGIIHRNTARFREALAHHREAIDIYRGAGDKSGLAKTLTHAGAALGELGRIDEEMRDLSEALAIYRSIGDLRGEAITLNTIGTVHHLQGLHRDAVRSYAASLDIFRQLGERQILAVLEHNIGQVHQYKGNYPAAIASYREVLETYQAIGDRRHQAYALIDIGSVLNNMNRFDEALDRYEQAASLGEAVNDHNASTRALCGIAEAHFGAARLDAALERYEEAIRLSGEIESLYWKGKALNGIGEIALQTRGRDAGRIILREAHDIFVQLRVPEAGTVELRLQALDERDPRADEP